LLFLGDRSPAMLQGAFSRAALCQQGMGATLLGN